MLKVGVMVSGGGTNLQAIMDKIESGYLKDCRIVTVVSDKAKAYALERAKKAGIDSKTILKKDYKDLKSRDKALVDHFRKYQADLIVMAGYLSIVGEDFVSAFENRIINIHPSLIPAFSGKGYYGIIPHKKALEYGVKVTGATVHFVTLETDAGPIILQKAVEIEEKDEAKSLQRKVMEEVEWEILPKAIKLFAENRLLIEGRRVRIIETTNKETARMSTVNKEAVRKKSENKYIAAEADEID